MRTHRWLKALAFGCCLGAGADAALAQAPFMGGDGGTWVTADGSPAPAPGSFQPPYATNDPSVLYPPGTPPGFAPYPAISPYNMGNVAQDMTYNKGGTWFRDILHKRRDYYFGVSALSTMTRGPGHATIGAETVPLDPDTFGPRGYTPPNYGLAPYPTAVGGGTGAAAVTSTTPASRVFISDNVNPFPYLRPSTTGTPTQTLDSRIFPVRSTKIFNEFNSPGIQLDWGFEEEDGSGLHVDAWWGFNATQTFQMGTDRIDGIEINQQLIINTEGQFLFTKNGAVTWDTGIIDGIAAAATPNQSLLYGSTIGAQKYDVMYRVQLQSEAGGGDIQMMLPDLFPSTSGIRLRPVYGAKYTYLGETFEFRGIDSGLSYTVGTGTGTGGGAGGGTAAAASTFRPTPFTTPIIDADLFETQVNSRTRTHLAGPTAGLRYDFGRSRNFKIWGQSNVGVMANYEQVRVNGFNAGEIVATTFLTGTNMLAGDSSFSDEEINAHVSPLFEQTFMSESRILAALPVTREIPFLAEANLKIGYTALFIGNVARPADSIQWNGFPRSPKVDIDYMTWSQGRWNFGLEWTY